MPYGGQTAKAAGTRRLPVRHGGDDNIQMRRSGFLDDEPPTPYPHCAPWRCTPKTWTNPTGANRPPARIPFSKTVKRLGASDRHAPDGGPRHYVTLWSRIGAYDPSMLDTLTCAPEARRLFEGWFHAACFLPLTEYRYQLPQQRALRGKRRAPLVTTSGSSSRATAR